MTHHLIFVFYLLIFLFSTIGFGYLFSNFFFKDFRALNFGYQGIIGFFTICLISGFTSFFSPHSFIHNILLHFVGIVIFFWNFFKHKKDNIVQIKKYINVK